MQVFLQKYVFLFDLIILFACRNICTLISEFLERTITANDQNLAGLLII